MGWLSFDFPIMDPQEGQNRAPGSSRVPQREQAGGGAIRAPQASQNAAPSGIGLLHRGHDMVFFFFEPGSLMYLSLVCLPVR